MVFYPVDAAESCLRRARRFLDLADEQLPIANVKNDLRRMAIVMGAAAIDSYMHLAVLRHLSTVRDGDAWPGELRRLDIPFEDYAHLADLTLDARRRDVEARPWVAVKAAVRQRLLKETFQSFEQVGRAMSMAGIQNGWSRVATELGEPTEAVRTRLNALVQRRNHIVHEGDFLRADRPRHMQFNDVDHGVITQDVAWLGRLVEAFESVIAPP